MAVAKVKTPEWEDILLELDLDKVNSEINAVEAGQPEMPDYERQDVRSLVLIAAERWLPYDLVEWELLGVEENYDSPTFRAILDLRGRQKGVLPAFKEYAGAPFCGDWKTTKGALDADWANRYKYSHQWPLYVMAYPETRLFTYRGVSRNGDTREVIIEVPDGKVLEAQEYLKDVQAMRAVLKDSPRWPRKMPGSCKAYGRECEFIDTCRENIIIPGTVDFNKPMSYSSAETFLLCPEKHRLTQISGYGEDDETLAFGKAFHRGIAEVYKQAFNLGG